MLTIAVKQSGHAILTVHPKNGGPAETYLITLRTCYRSSDVRADLSAKLRIEGIIWGAPYIELVETSAIQSSTGYTAQVRHRVVRSIVGAERGRSTTRARATFPARPTPSRRP
jgi:hypothetical protein